MPIKLVLKQEFFDFVYIKNDVQQIGYHLVGVLVSPGHNKYHISNGAGEVIEVYEGEISFDRDDALRLSFDAGE